MNFAEMDRKAYFFSFISISFALSLSRLLGFDSLLSNIFSSRIALRMKLTVQDGSAPVTGKKRKLFMDASRWLPARDELK